ncbi:MAG TPA: sugar ABC transporter ATP-binding protein [Anaerohalosphaeraceae bacterium]|nr:sugar ABC transporter ATP-binding protein [Anaerohalosphaeraceae bacterium]
MEMLLAMKNISKSFGPVEVLKDVCFGLQPGEVHILAGENGAGKSTLMKIVGGVYPDYTGTIEVKGRPVRFRSVLDAAAAGIAVIHQELSLVGSMSVYENIFLGREVHRKGWVCHARMRSSARSLLEELGLSIRVDEPVDRLPIGQQQMVEIAKALSYNADILVMDEPTSALTEPEVRKLFDIIARLKRKGCGIIYITHKMEEIYQIADRITVLRDGRYIGTEEAAKLSSDRLVQWMVGREIQQHFPRHQSQPGPVRLEVSDFTVPEPAGGPIPWVNCVSFTVHAGEIVGLAGLQGSGNSHLLHGLFGSYGRRVRGTVRIDGQVMPVINPAQSIRSGLALLTNDRKTTGLILGRDIIENASLASLRRFSPGGWMRPHLEAETVSRTLQRLRLKADRLTLPVEALSGGNQQKVVLAKWIQTDPKVLLLDEPTRGVDVGAKHEIYQWMNEWTKAGIAIVLITSEMPELLAMSDRILVMHRGCITAHLTRQQATQEKILQAALGQTLLERTIS